MSWKSIVLSIVGLVLMVGLLFVVVFLFNIYFVFGIIGIIIWFVVPGLVITKARNEAVGLIDTLIAKYVIPILGAVLALGTIIYIVFKAIEA